MDLTNWQRRAVIIIFLAILLGAILLARKEPLREKTTEPAASNTAPLTPAPAIIDINTADLPLLIKLPGIGPGLAKQIIDYRSSHGPFHNMAELENVPGMGPKRTAAIKKYLKLPEAASAPPGNLINLNTATIQQLITVPGIGLKTAQRIIDYRTEKGSFSSSAELQQVPHIGPKTYANIKNYFFTVPAANQASDNKPEDKFVDTRQGKYEIDTEKTCPHCGRKLHEEGKKKRVHLRCPHCLKLLNQ